MMTHTKGPWKWVDEYDGTDADFSRMDSATLVNSEGQGVVFYADFDSATFGSMEMAKANARLIAAAPDLLEALEDAVTVMTKAADAWPIKYYGQDLFETLEMVKVAIAKAKGKTNEADN